MASTDVNTFGTIALKTLYTTNVTGAKNSTGARTITLTAQKADASKNSTAVLTSGDDGTAGTLVFSGNGTGAGATVRISGVADPSASSDVATKAYVDNLLDVKASCRLATLSTDAVALATANGFVYSGSGLGTLTAQGTSALSVTAVDGVNLTTSDRVLVKDRVDKVENGIYTVTTAGANGTATTVLSRAVDMATGLLVAGSGAFTFIEDGTSTTNIGYGYVLQRPVGQATVTVGTDQLTFVKLSAGQTYTGTSPIVVSGSTISFATNANFGLPLTASSGAGPYTAGYSSAVGPTSSTYIGTDSTKLLTVAATDTATRDGASFNQGGLVLGYDVIGNASASGVFGAPLYWCNPTATGAMRTVCVKTAANTAELRIQWLNAGTWTTLMTVSQ